MQEDQIAPIRRLIAQFQEHLDMQGYSVRTFRGYAQELRPFLDYLRTREEETLTDVTAETLHHYQLHLYRLKTKDKPLSLSTQSNRLIAVRSFFRHLVRRGRVLADPSSGLAMPKVGRSLPRGIMTLREVQKVLAQPDADTPLGLRDKAILEVLYSTGIRNAELRALGLYDVDAAEGELRVRGGKGGTDRVVPMGEIAAHYVDRYLQHARPVLAARAAAPAAALFLNRYGGRLTDKALSGRIVARYVRMARITKHITPHSFRHTCATHMLKGRANIRHIQALLGHRSLETTQVYTRVEVSDLKKEHRRTHPREQAR